LQPVEDEEKNDTADQRHRTVERRERTPRRNQGQHEQRENQIIRLEGTEPVEEGFLHRAEPFTHSSTFTSLFLLLLHWLRDGGQQHQFLPYISVDHREDLVRREVLRLSFPLHRNDLAPLFPIGDETDLGGTAHLERERFAESAVRLSWANQHDLL